MKIIIGLFLFISIVAHAQTDDDLTARQFADYPPNFCKQGKERNPVVIGGKCENESCTFDYRALADSFKYLETEIGKYQLYGSTIRVKGDGAYAVNSGDRVHFFDSVGGYRGSDKANTEGNAYKTYEITGPNTNWGHVLVWTMKWKHVNAYSIGSNTPQDNINLLWNDLYGPNYVQFAPQANSSTNYIIYGGEFLCSVKEIFLQHKPHISPSGFTAPFRISGELPHHFGQGFPIYYELDVNSKAIHEGTGGTITLYSYTKNLGKRIAGSVKVNDARGVVNIYPSNYSVDPNGVTFSAVVNDGTYSQEIELGTLFYRPSMPSDCAIKCPLNMYPPNLAMCQMNTRECDYKNWN